MTKTIWIDLDNSPHVPFFFPIVRELEARGHCVRITARDCFQVCGLADRHKLRYTRVGRHYGANKLLKIVGTLWRSVQLLPFVLKHRPDVSLSHGSRPLVLLSALLRIRTLLLFDYEHARLLPFIRPDMGMAPEAIKDPALASRFRFGLRNYHGLKEDVYVASFRPDSSLLQDLNLKEDEIIATIRPPATEAHYHNPAAEELFVAVVGFLGEVPGCRMVVLPRNEKTQREFLYRKWPQWCETGKIVVPSEVLDGLNLIWHSDLIVSGGGTMNREAAALGIPVYSIFRGKLGAVDRYLAECGRLTLIETPADVFKKIRAVRRNREHKVPGQQAALNEILQSVDELMGVKVSANVPSVPTCAVRDTR